MNIEFVYLILLGINNFMENQIVIRKGSAISNRQGSSKIQIRKTEQDTRITLCDVRFMDIEKWNVEEMNRM